MVTCADSGIKLLPDLEGARIVIEPKASEPRRIYFNDALWWVFREAGKVRSLEHRFVFHRRGKPLKDIRGGFNKAVERAGIEDFRFHDLRHTFNTNMRKAGVPQSVIMKLTGHKTNAMFHRYDTVDQDDAIQAMNRLDAHLGTIFSRKSSDMVQTEPERDPKRG